MYNLYLGTGSPTLTHYCVLRYIYNVYLGTGSPTLILDAPTGRSSDVFLKLQSTLASLGTVCIYDRFSIHLSIYIFEMNLTNIKKVIFDNCFTQLRAHQEERAEYYSISIYLCMYVSSLFDY